MYQRFWFRGYDSKIKKNTGVIKMNKYFYKLVKAFTADPKNKDDLSFSKFKRWILWNPEYGYIAYNSVRGYKETEYLETLKAVQNENN